MVSWATPLEARPRGFTGCHRRPRHFLRNQFSGRDKCRTLGSRAWLYASGHEMLCRTTRVTPV
ncbi:hypothetical protein C7T35_39440 [Variovorax sp. WS11]|nr:hypothetical protein C7T35_39440 [Variovorax sp. WS11]